MPCSVSLFNSVWPRNISWRPWKHNSPNLHQISPMRVEYAFVLAFFFLRCLSFTLYFLTCSFRWFDLFDGGRCCWLSLSSDCNRVPQMFVPTSGFNIQPIITDTCECIIIVFELFSFSLPAECCHLINIHPLVVHLIVPTIPNDENASRKKKCVCVCNDALYDCRERAQTKSNWVPLMQQ